jgi:methylenetetrahydrofolate dehydrogenase (NADP+)/methenyltetrahydrofolate cyclohydrolase
MEILDGKLVSQTIRNQLKEKVSELKKQGKKLPHLAAILVGSHGASETYVAGKVKSCEEIGFGSTLIRLSDSVSESELLENIEALNLDPDVDGILVQLPLPKHISEQKVIETVSVTKDVDGFHPESVGRMVQGLPAFVSATPHGIMLLLEHYKIDTRGNM